MRKYLPTKGSKCYLLCGFEGQDWRDIASVFRSLQILWEAQTIGYVMRHENHRLASPLCRPIYTHLARWANQPKFQRAIRFSSFASRAVARPSVRRLAFEKAYPEVAKEYFDMKYKDSPR